MIHERSTIDGSRQTRAKALADTLRDAGVTAILTSQWLRAKDTAQPLADLLNIAPQVIPTADPPHEYFQATANAVRRLKDETVLVVGHITIPNIIAELGGPQLPTICEGVFSDLFLLIPALGRDGLTRQRYGAHEEISPRCRDLLDCDWIQTTNDEITTDFARHVNSSQWFDIVRFLLLELKEHGNAI